MCKLCLVNQDNVQPYHDLPSLVKNILYTNDIYNYIDGKS